MNTTEITLDAVVLMETIDEYVGRTVRFTSHGMEFRGELVTVLDRGNGVATDRRLTVILRGNTEAMTGFRTRIAIEFPSAPTVRRGPMPTVEYNGKVYKVRSRKTEIPDLAAMDSIPALMWLLRNTTPKGTNHRRPAPNLPNLPLTVR